MAVIFCAGGGAITCMCKGGNNFSAFLSNEPLNLPILCGIPSQDETFSPGLWFDQCSDQVRLAVSTGTTGWSAGGALPYNINQGNGGGTQNAAYHYGGTLGTGNPAVSCTAEYNGSSWSAGGALPAIRRLLFRGCVGTQNAGIAIFGFSAPSNFSTTYEYNGTSWSSGGSGACAVRNGAAFGTQNSAAAAGGFTSVVVNGTQEYNGTSWSGGGNLITSRQSVQGAGQSQNQGWTSGGTDGAGTIIACTETYNGTSWSTSGALPTAQQIGGSSGRQAYGFFAGGRSPAGIVSSVSLFDGYLWTSTCSLPFAVACNAAAGDGRNGIVFSGQNPAGTVVACTQEWNNPWDYFQIGT
jgi:hypothetical protein